MRNESVSLSLTRSGLASLAAELHVVRPTETTQTRLEARTSMHTDEAFRTHSSLDPRDGTVDSR
jgi:hypothetical protein